jgi:hypothetical protein
LCNFKKKIIIIKKCNIYNSIQEIFEETKRSAEAVNGRKIDNTMVKRKKDTRTNNDDGLIST